MSGLISRPGPTPEEVAVVIAAFSALNNASVSDIVPVTDDTPVWRFSARSW